jgi:single-stranded-DNA-specific exonuclease
VLMPPGIWQLLYRRGVRTAKDLETLYNPTLKSLRSPFTLKDMDLAVDRLLRARAQGEQVALYGDFDMDGSPGLALLSQGLQGLGFQQPLWAQPLRLKDGYGLHSHILKDLRDRGATLLVTVDVGITDVEAVDFSNSIGLEVIVTDHHQQKDVLPKALAVVNPNRVDCESGLGFLCGTGVAFFLILALRSALEKSSADVSGFQPKNLLDLFSLATVADLVPLVGENRTLVKHGLRVLSQTQNPGLRALLSELELLGKSLTAADIGFKIAPKLNSLSRMEEGLRPADVLLASAEGAPAVVLQTFAINRLRKSKQEDALAQALVETAAQPADGPVTFLALDEVHPGVISVVATRLSEIYDRPVFLAARRSDGRVIGSARARRPEDHVLQALEASAAALVKFGGHPVAAGFETRKELEPLLRTLLEKHFSEKPKATASHLDGNQPFDSAVTLSEIDDSFMRWFDGLEPFGPGFPQPIFKASNVMVKDVRTMNGGHLRLTVGDGSGPSEHSALWFSPQMSVNRGDQLDLYFVPQWNEWRGQKKLQLLVQTAVGRGSLRSQ